MVCVQGIATKVSAVLPKLVESVHHCEETEKTTRRAYRDATDGGVPTSSVFPTKDDEENVLTAGIWKMCF